MVPDSHGDFVDLQDVLGALAERDTHIRRLENRVARLTRRLNPSNERVRSVRISGPKDPGDTSKEPS